jgi:excisionase family DNA binding protein
METKLLKGPEVAEILGISKALAYRLISQGFLPAVKFGRTVRVRPEDLEKFILDNLTCKQSERINDAQPNCVSVESCLSPIGKLLD